MTSPNRKTEAPAPAKYRPTVRARLRNTAWTIAILASWPIAKVLTLMERLRTHE